MRVVTRDLWADLGDWTVTGIAPTAISGGDALFDAIPTRSGWTTPWGGPPDTRSIAIGPAGLFAGVHVGGVWRREATGWTEVVTYRGQA